jgi:chorismate dehydratase
VKVGAIAFINTLPIYYGLDLAALSAQVGQPVTLHYGNPTWLNGQMLSRGLDLSPVSMSHYLAHQNQLALVPGLSVSSFGAVESVLFVNRHRFGEGLADCPVIPVPDSSASSVALLGWLLEQATGVDFRPRFQVYPAGQLAEALAQHGCALSIGDEALLFRHSQAVTVGGAWQCHDLATLWHERTGLPFVFAVWVRPVDNPMSEAALGHVMAGLQANMALNFVDSGRFDSLLDQATAHHAVPRAVVAHYLRQSLDFNWDPPHEQAVRAFEASVLQ